MAEVLLRAALPLDTDWRVISAGTSATPGSAASDASCDVIKEYGLSLDSHRSQLLTQDLVEDSAMIVAMTQRHIEKILHCVPSARDRVYLMRAFDATAPKGSDVFDPYCGTLENYRACRDMIQQALPGLVHTLTQLCTEENGEKI